MLRRLTAALATLAVAILPLAAAAQITPGTTLVGTIDQSLDSGSAQVGTPVTASNVHSPDYNINGATLYGQVVAVQRASQGRPGGITLNFTKLHTRSGNSYAVDGRATQVQENAKSNTVKEVGGAVAGMIVGNIIGKMVGTNLGGALGAGGGYILARNNKTNVVIPANSVLTVQVLSARRQAGR